MNIEVKNIPECLYNRVKDHLRSADFAVPDSPLSCQSLLGGSTCQVWRVYLSREQSIAIKYKTDCSADFFSSQARTLQFLAELKVKVPRVIFWQKDCLVLEDMAGGVMLQKGRIVAQNRALGISLARLHSHVADQFGFVCDNYLGICKQNNSWNSDWSEFFWQQRLHPLLHHPLLTQQDLRGWLKLSDRLPQLLSHKPIPRLCHGDAWANNFLYATNSDLIMIDPACAYTDVALEWAYMDYFKLLDATGIEAYTNLLQRPPYLAELIPLYQLYLLLVHVHQCGASYLAPLRKRLRYYVG